MRLTRYGRREWLTASVIALVLAAAFAWPGWWWLVAVTAAAWLAVALFFRDPARRVPADLPPEALVSPADGRVTAVETVDHHDALDGPAVVVRIFLSVLNVHVNRAPGAGEVLAVRHARGRFHDARSPESAVENESRLVVLRLDEGPTIAVRQIVGAVARRIVCELRPGDRVARGQRFGMIKFGSGTELILPPRRAEVRVRAGDRVKGGLTTLATLARSTAPDAGSRRAADQRPSGAAAPLRR